MFAAKRRGERKPELARALARLSRRLPRFEAPEIRGAITLGAIICLLLLLRWLKV
jgi:hypothetical protein